MKADELLSDADMNELRSERERDLTFDINGYRLQNVGRTINFDVSDDGDDAEDDEQ